ncbi:hypothetical protein C900_03651 [Fulvivirga imtechensis AK7]|uniref:Beta-lactamase-related domain-containing protein n=1 Tax=Fulvivirga imtechensis AK7 TaxID=1237149 RepID=L8JT05_9BACT|nr:serine hydrolase domain-containing protein [Fulvivirga imtechensis]ELR70492.1 hypothetical protein C900_03651 [Fulvivirga imtechensis AK7]
MVNIENIHASIDLYLREKVKNNKKLHNAYLLVHSDRHDIHFNMAAGHTDGTPAHKDQPYHIASIGKLFTAVILAILEEKEMISYHSRVVDYLPEELLTGLHLYKGRDYTYDIQIRHLLNHSSGIADYFTDKPKRGRPILDRILEEPSRVWTPQETIGWTKKNLPARFPPGSGFHYSDTGYHLLGLLIEKVTLKKFDQVLHDLIFKPLDMKQSYLTGYSQPAVASQHPRAGLYVNRVNVIDYPSLSIDYAGGGITSTSEDLLKFMKALVNHELISFESFDKMKDWSKFNLGMDYGYGLMNVRTHAFPFLMSRKYNIWGNAGAIGSFMFYNAAMDVYIIGNFNLLNYVRQSFVFMLKVLRKLSKAGLK